MGVTRRQTDPRLLLSPLAQLAMSSGILLAQLHLKSVPFQLLACQACPPTALEHRRHYLLG